jgi:peptide/nickel transport system substrate-binding protein
MTLTGAVNPYWFTYNQLSQITPMPLAWDVAGTGEKAGSQACATASFADVTVTAVSGKSPSVTPVSAAAKSCAAVFTYLSEQSGFDPSNPKAPNNSLSTYATSPIWSVVDGPWKLSSFNSTGYAAFKPNPVYSGPTKAHLASFVELPYTSAESEFNALVGGKITVGYLPPEDVTASAKSPTVAGPNNPRLSDFSIAPWYPWGINYFPYNFNSTGDGGEAGTIFKQLYFRQAFQMLVDEPLYIKKLYKGYAVPTYGPVPVLPKNSFATAFEQTNPYPTSTKNAIALLEKNGWKVVPNGVDTCSDAAKCGVPAGTKLSFTIQYAVPTATQTEQMEAEQSAWAEAGIQVKLTTATFDTVIGNATACSGASCTWEFEDWAGGWTYSPDFYPTGEVLFETGSGSNVGSYSDAKDDALIKATDFGSTSLGTWEDYLAKQLPFVWQPEEAYQLTEVKNGLKGVTPQNPLLNINPENWYY